MDKKKLRRAPLFVAAAAVLPLALGACSSNSSSTSNAASATGGGSSSGQTGQAQFAQCMRSNGVTNFPDPTNGHLLMQPGVQSNPNFRSAMQTCQHYLGPGGITSGGANTGAMLSFAHCMQTHGVPSFPDPTGNGEIMAPKGVDKNSPTYQNAFSECKSKLPGGGSGFAG